MTQIILNPGQVQQLETSPALVECRDDSGKLVGYLHIAQRNDSTSIPDLSIEQLAEYEREPGGRSLGEILTDLRKRR